MNLSVICPHCQARLKPKNALPPGKSVRCPGCKELFVPEAETYAVAPSEEERSPSELVQARTGARVRAGEAVARRADTTENEEDASAPERPRKKKRAKKKPEALGPAVRAIAGLRQFAAPVVAAVPVFSRLNLSGKRLRRFGVLLVAGVVIFAVVKFAMPSKPPWQRKLTEDDQKKAQQLTRQIIQFEANGKFAQALKAAEELAQFREKRQGADHWQARAVRSEIDTIERVQQQPQDAQEEFSSTFKLLQKAQGFISKGDHRDALPLQEQVLAIRRKVLGEDDPHTAESYLGVALNLNAQGKYSQAEEGFRKSLAIRQKVLGNDNPQLAESYTHSAENLSAEGKCAEAEEGYRKALAISLRVLGEENAFTATIYNNIAMNLNAQGKYAQAEEGYRKALAINRKVLGEAHRFTARAYNNVAFNLGSQFKIVEAAAGFAKALEIARKVLGEEHPQTANNYNNLAGNLSAQGKYAEAEEGLRKALAIRQKVLGEEHPRTAGSYNTMAFNLDRQAKYTEAEANFRKALAIYQKVLGKSNPLTAATFDHLGLNLSKQGKYVEADQLLRHALEIRRKVLGEKHANTAASYSNLARNLNAQGKYAEAERYWTRAVDSFTKAREDLASSGLDRTAITAERSPLPLLAAVLARNGKPVPAWQRFEESLGRGILDDLAARLSRPAAEQATEAGLIARLSRLDQLIEDATVDKPTDEQKKASGDLLAERRQVQDELDKFNRSLEQNYGHAAGEVSELHKIQATLPVYTALVGWLDLPGQPRAADPSGEHWAFVLRSSGVPAVVRLHGTGPNAGWSDDDTQLPADLRKALQDELGEWQPLAERLRKQRLEPLRSPLAASGGLPAVKRLIVLPSAALAGVPVEAFAEGYTVSYALSGTLHARNSHLRNLTSSGLLALADPVFTQPGSEPASKRGLDDDGLSRGGKRAWKRLPGTRVEVEALRQLFGGQKATVLSDSPASEQKLYELAKTDEVGKYRYLHFATHGTADETFPLHSAIILSNDKLPDPGKQLDAGLPVFDGELTAEEILRQWHLNAELVTLSACETALGKYERGEGFIGFAQALILVGSRAVCLSLWEADDTATALLMSRFYANMLAQREGLTNPMPKAVALAEAKAWLRNLPRDQARQLTAQLGKGAARGKGRPALPVLPEATKVPGEAASETDKDRPYDHPCYWAAFVLIGDPD